MGEVANNWQTSELNDSLHSQTMVLNMGPSHPATHGTVRLIVELDGEIVRRCDVDVGYLHRGFEKEAENTRYHQVIPYTDRLNYVSPVINNVGFCLAVESLLGVEVPPRGQAIRVVLSELSRIADHLTCLGAAAMELGSFTVMLYMMEARESIYELIEMVTGARVTVSYSRIGGLRNDLPDNFREAIAPRFKKINKLLKDCDKLLIRNRIFVDRLAGVGVIAADEAVAYGLTGPMLRASGVNYDVRKVYPYCGYENYNFEIPLGTKGDCYDRYLVRFNEIEQAMNIVEQAMKKMPGGSYRWDDPRITLPAKDEVYGSIEGLITQFKLVYDGIKPPPGEVYFPVEGGNGELGFYLVSDGTNHPYRVHVRAPSFVHMGIFGRLVEGYSVADVVAMMGMMNMIGGECDR